MTTNADAVDARTCWGEPAAAEANVLASPMLW